MPTMGKSCKARILAENDSQIDLEITAEDISSDLQYEEIMS